MLLNKSDKIKLIEAINLLKTPTAKSEVSEGVNTPLKIEVVRYHDNSTIDEYLKLVDRDDKKLFGDIADKVISYVKANCPEVLPTLKAKYFN